MDEHVRAENEALKELFQTEGWRVLMRNTQSHVDAFRSGFPFNVNTLEQLYFTRGMVAALQTLLDMESQLERLEEPEDETVPWEE